MNQELQRRALQLHQHPDHAVYVFCLRPQEVLQVAEISRIDRDEAQNVIGYQRDEVKKHVDDIRQYLDAGSVLFPNPIILALSDEVGFKGSRGPANDDGLARSGVGIRHSVHYSNVALQPATRN